MKAAIFDLDGVIVNTVPLHFKAWKMMFSEYGKEFNFDDYKQKVDGIPRMDGARAILTDLSDEELKKAADKKQVYFLEYLNSEDIPVYNSWNPRLPLQRCLQETCLSFALTHHDPQPAICFHMNLPECHKQNNWPSSCR